MLFVLFGLLTVGVTALAIRICRSAFGSHGHLISVLTILFAMPTTIYVYNEFIQERGNIGDFIFGVVLYVSVAIPACAVATISLFWYNPLRKWLDFRKDK